jgi:hypothetical protein
VLLLLKAYVDFSTSGLENPLAHLLILAAVLSMTSATTFSHLLARLADEAESTASAPSADGAGDDELSRDAARPGQGDRHRRDAGSRVNAHVSLLLRVPVSQYGVREAWRGHSPQRACDPGAASTSWIQ